MPKNVLPLPLNGEERKELLEAIEATVHIWKKTENIQDFVNRKPLWPICIWSKQFAKTLAKAYKLKLDIKDDMCRFCPAYALNHNRVMCTAVEKAYTNAVNDRFDPIAFISFKDKVLSESERLLLLHKSQTGTSIYRRHVVEQLKLSQKLAKRNTKKKRRTANESKAKTTKHKKNKL